MNDLWMAYVTAQTEEGEAGFALLTSTYPASEVEEWLNETMGEDLKLSHWFQRTDVQIDIFTMEPGLPVTWRPRDGEEPAPPNPKAVGFTPDCRYCGGDVVGQPFDGDSSAAWQKVVCQHEGCSAVYTEVYTPDSIIVHDPPEVLQ